MLGYGIVAEHPFLMKKKNTKRGQNIDILVGKAYNQIDYKKKIFWAREKS